MRPVELLTKIVLFDVCVPLLFVGLSVYKVVQHLRGVPLTTQGWLFVLLAGGGFALTLFLVTPDRLRDALSFWRIQEAYLQRTECRVAEVTWAFPSTLLGNETLYCENGARFYIRYQPRYARVRKEGRLFTIYYLPRSRIVVRLEPETGGRDVGRNTPLPPSPHR